MDSDSNGPLHAVTSRRILPVLGAVLSVLGAIVYGIVLGFAPVIPATERTVTFVLMFAALGGGIAWSWRRWPISAGAGLAAFVILPLLQYLVGGVSTWPLPVTYLNIAGGTALAVFLIAVLTEILTDEPSWLERAINGRDALAGTVIGLASTGWAFWAGLPTGIGAGQDGLGLLFPGLVVAAWALFLIGAVLAAVLFLTRHRLVGPSLLLTGMFLIAALGDGGFGSLWSPTPRYLSEHGIVVLLATLAVGLLELSIRTAVTGRTTPAVG